MKIKKTRHAVLWTGDQTALFHRVTGAELLLNDRTHLLWNALTSLGGRQPSDISTRRFLNDLRGGGFVLKPSQSEPEIYLRFYAAPNRNALYVPKKDGRLQLFFEKRGRYLGNASIRRTVLSPFLSDLYLKMDGTRTLGQILDGCRSSARLEEIISSPLFDPDFQLVRLSRAPLRSGRGLFAKSLYSFRAPFRHPRAVRRTKKKSLKHFHRFEIRDAKTQFDSIETTLSHAFRPHFGESLFDRLECESWISPHSSILEVGGGTGYLARGFLNRAAKKWGSHSLRYQLVDLSPVLLEYQKKILREFDSVSFAQEDAQTMRLRKKFDLILCNEAVADFKIARRDGRLFNAGAVQFLRRAWTHLEKGGRAVITEFGSMNHVPVPTTLLNHDEHSIFWPDLLRAARKLGFRARVETLASFLDFPLRTPVFTGNVAVLKHLGRGEVEPRVYTEKELQGVLAGLKKKNVNVGGVFYEPLGAGRHFGPPFSQFKALILRK